MGFNVNLPLIHGVAIIRALDNQLEATNPNADT